MFTYSLNKHLLALGTVNAAMNKHPSGLSPHGAQIYFDEVEFCSATYLAVWPWVSHTFLGAIFFHSEACAMCHSHCWSWCWGEEAGLPPPGRKRERERGFMIKQQVWPRRSRHFLGQAKRKWQCVPHQRQKRLHRGRKEEMGDRDSGIQ